MLKKNSNNLLYRIRFTCFKCWSDQPYQPVMVLQKYIDGEKLAKFSFHLWVWSFFSPIFQLSFSWSMLTIADNDEEDRFQALCRAVMEYRGTMKEYCKVVCTFSLVIYVFSHILFMPWTCSFVCVNCLLRFKSHKVRIQFLVRLLMHSLRGIMFEQKNF